MRYLLYDLATSVAAVGGAAYLAAHPRYRRLLSRFAPAIPPQAVGGVCVQACSVGEVGVARQLLAAMHSRWPDVPALLTVSTVTGRSVAEQQGGSCPIAWFPFDHRISVERFFSAMRPRVLVLVETEIWPNILRIAADKNIPVVMISGRLSDRHFERYKRHAFWFKPLFGALSAAGMQTEEYAGRIKQLGIPPCRVHVTGNIKFDGAVAAVPEAQSAQLRLDSGIPDQAPVVVFGSTRPGDEARAASAWKCLREMFPELRMIVAPRHATRLREALEPFAGESFLLRSEMLSGKRINHERIIVLDTVGELASFYALASAVVIGGSFDPAINGHNPIEPAALGVPTLFGPYMRNFKDAAALLESSGGARQVQEEELPEALKEVLSDRQLRECMGAHARATVLQNQGALKRTLDLLEPFMHDGGYVHSAIETDS